MTEQLLTIGFQHCKNLRSVFLDQKAVNFGDNESALPALLENVDILAMFSL